VRGTSDTVLVTTQTVGALIFGFVVAPLSWVTPSSTDLILLVLLGVTAMIAHMCINRSLKLAPASVVVPYQYTTIVWAVLLGYLIFHDVPSLPMLLGVSIIIAAGIYIFLREEAPSSRVVVDPPA